MKLDLKAATVALTFSLLTACGGGGGNGGGTASLNNSGLPGSTNLLENTNGPLQLNDRTEPRLDPAKTASLEVTGENGDEYHVVEENKDESNHVVEEEEIESNDSAVDVTDGGGDEYRVVEDNKDESNHVVEEEEVESNDYSALDWYHETTFTPDLIKFARSYKEKPEEVSSEFIEHVKSYEENSVEPHPELADRIRSILRSYEENSVEPPPEFIELVRSLQEKTGVPLINEPPVDPIDEEYPGYINFVGYIPVFHNGDQFKLGVFGTRSKSDDEAFVIFDDHSGLASGGSQLNGVPSGQHTYKGYNFFMYTDHSVGQYEGYIDGGSSKVLQNGDFEMEVDFNAGTGSIAATAGLTWLTFLSSNGTMLGTVPGTKLSGDITVDATKGIFAGNGLILTKTLMKDDAREGRILGEGGQFNGWEIIPVEEIGSAKIQGSFHGNEGEGVSGIYRHDVEENEQFQGGIVGNQDRVGTYTPANPLKK